jgi:tRNA-2-methylthio-N6-dimethylallyladenosine synthase
MNERDSEAIASILQHAGHVIVADERVADVVILNTCSVREQAEIKAMGKAGHLARRRRMQPDFKIGIVGCMAENLGSEIFDRNADVDFVVGPAHLHELPEIIKQDRRCACTGSVVNSYDSPDFSHDLAKSKYTAFISIMQGCNMRCSYCIVPKTRGREQYRQMENIIEEANFLAKNGVKEITLLGQIVNNYGGRQFPVIDGKTPFVQLLEQLNAIDGISRIRYMSPHPHYFSDDLISAHRKLAHLCPSVHLPVQSGSNRILRAMNRSYTRGKFLETVNKLRDSVPDIGISTDIIVGYPGETNEEFEETVSLFDAVKFNMAFIFKYSPRPGTQSVKLFDNVTGEEKERRNQILLRRVEETSFFHNQKMIGTNVEILVEGHAKRGKNTMFGWTPNHHKVLFDGDAKIIGRTVLVRIENCTTTILSGTVICSQNR